MRVEVVTRFKMGRAKENHLGIGVVGARPVVVMPEGVPCTGTGTADVGVRVVAVNAPCLQHTVRVALMAWTSDVVNHSVASTGVQRCTDFSGNVVKDFVPCHLLPLPLTTLSDPLERVKNAFSVVDLVDGRRSFCTVSASASRVMWVPLEPG